MRNIIALLATLLLITYIIIDLIYDDNLWNTNTKFTKYLQQNQFYAENYIFDFFTIIVYLPPVIAAIAFILLNKKLNVLLYIAIVALSASSNSLLKNLYHQPRPYMAVPSIHPYKCNASFGKPSGHAQNSIVMTFIIPYLLIPQLYKFSGSITSKIYKGLILFLFGVSTFMTGLSRVFLGVHSIGQVLLGWVYGLYIIIIYICIVDIPLKKLMIQYLADKKNRNRMHIFIITILSSLIILWFNILFLELNRNVFFDDNDAPYDWLERIQECDKDTSLTLQTPQILYNVCFLQVFTIYLVPALVLGVLLIDGIYQEGSFTTHHSKLLFKQKAIRVLLLILPLVILVPLIFINTQYVYVQGFCQFLPAILYAGFLLTAIHPYLLNKFKLQLKGDFMQLESDYAISEKIEVN